MAIDEKHGRISREPAPEELAMASEADPPREVPDLSPAERAVLDKIWRRMRIFRPDLYKVFKPWIECLELRDERSAYSHGLYRGWYAEHARKLRLTENAVKARLRAAQKWFARRIERELDREIRK